MGQKNAERFIGYMLDTSNRYMKIYFSRRIKNAGLNVTAEQWSILKIVHANPGISQTEIARISMKDKTNVTRMLDVLERDGYITRDNHKTDRRLYKISLTESGKEILMKLFELAEQLDSEITGQLGENETEMLLEGLGKICSYIENKLLE